MAEETAQRTDEANYRLPGDTTLKHVVKLGIVEDKPIMMDYWAASCDKQVLIGVREGGEKLLVPINADDSSIFAITGLFNLIWGTTKVHPVYGKYTFAAKAASQNLELPKISLLLGNRFTQKIGAAHAFKALSNEAIEKMYSEYKSNPDKFENPEINNIFNRIYRLIL